MHPPGEPLQLLQTSLIHGGLQRLQKIASIRAFQHGTLGRTIRYTQLQSHEKAIELRLRQREGADLSEWILRGNHEEWRGQGIRGTVRRHTAFLHRFEECRLRFRCASVDLIREQDLRKDRAWMKYKGRFFSVVNGGTEDISRQEITGELHPPELQPKGLRQSLGKHCFAHARHVLKEQVTPGEQTGHGEPDAGFFAQNDGPHPGREISQFTARALGFFLVRQIQWRGKG